MYVIYGQKTKGNKKADYPLNAQIKFLSELFDNQCWIFSVPGQLSWDSKVSDYIREFNALISKYSGNDQYIAFGNGYNASKRDKYAKEIDGNCSYSLKTYKVGLPAVRRNNHAKMLFYFMWKDEEVRDKYESGKETLTKSTLAEFLNAISVKAVIVGSSNQSLETYFREKAAKGEADVLLLASKSEPCKCVADKREFLDDIKWKNEQNGYNDHEQGFEERHKDFFDSNIISKSIFPLKDGETEEDYFNKIFRKCLSGELN